MFKSRSSNSLLLTTALCVAAAGAVYFTTSSRKKDGDEEEVPARSVDEGTASIPRDEDKPLSSCDNEGKANSVDNIMEREVDRVDQIIPTVEEQLDAVPVLIDETSDETSEEEEKKIDDHLIPTAKTMTDSDLSLLMLKEKDVDIELASTTASDMTGGDLSPQLDTTEDDTSLNTKTRKSLVGAFKKRLSRKNITTRLKKRREVRKSIDN